MTIGKFNALGQAFDPDLQNQNFRSSADSFQVFDEGGGLIERGALELKDTARQ